MLLPLVPYPLGRTVGSTHTDGGKPVFEPTLRTAAPTHSSPLRTGQHVFSCCRYTIRHVPFTWPASNFGNWPNELYPNRVHLEVTRDANRPGKLAGRQPLTERRTETVTGIRQSTAEAHADRYQAINLRQCDLGLCPCSAIFGRNTSSLQPPPIVDPTVW